MKYKTLREIWKQVMAEDDLLTREKLGEWGLTTRGSARHVKERPFRWEARNVCSKFYVPWDTKWDQLGQMNSEDLDEATICFDIGDSLIKRTNIGLKKGIEEVTTRKEPTELSVDIQDEEKTKEKPVVPD